MFVKNNLCLQVNFNKNQERNKEAFHVEKYNIKLFNNMLSTNKPPKQ